MSSCGCGRRRWRGGTGWHSSGRLSTATRTYVNADLAKLFTERGFDVGAAILAEDNAMVDVQSVVDHVEAVANVPRADSLTQMKIYPTIFL